MEKLKFDSGLCSESGVDVGAKYLELRSGQQPERVMLK